MCLLGGLNLCLHIRTLEDLLCYFINLFIDLGVVCGTFYFISLFTSFNL